MQISNAEHEELQDTLQKLNTDTWLQLATEIQYHGRDAPFWFLISGPDRLEAAASIVLPILYEAAIQFDGTNFSASFSEKGMVRRLSGISWTRMKCVPVFPTASSAHRQLSSSCVRGMCSAPTRPPGPDMGVLRVRVRFHGTTKIAK